MEFNVLSSYNLEMKARWPEGLGEKWNGYLHFEMAIYFGVDALEIDYISNMCLKHN